jgi:hypothetical protein
MTENKRTVEKYMDGFRKSDHGQILSCLTDDIEWVMPGEENDVVAADVFVMQGGKIRRLISYFMEVK